MYLRPYLSELRRHLIFMLSLQRREMSRSHVLLGIVTVALRLMPLLAAETCLRRVLIFDVIST